MSEVTAVSNVVHVSHQKQIVERVYKTPNGEILSLLTNVFSKEAA